jgi:PKD repeat protein
MTKVSLLAVVAALVAVGCGVDPPTTAPSRVAAHGTPSTIELSATPGSGEHGGQATVTARVLDAYALLLPDVSVTFGANAGTFSAATVSTNGNGIATTTLTADPGTVKLTAAAGGVSTPELPVTIQPVNVFTPPPGSPPPPLPLPPPTIPPPTPAPPSYGVTIVASPASVVIGTPTTLTATVTPLSGAPAVASWVWDCDTSTPPTDFTTANTAACTYATAGTFTASVRVTGGAVVGVGTTTVTVTAAPVPSYTVTVAASPATIAAGNSTTLTATVTRVNGAPTPTAWEWDCDTGATSIDFTSPITATCNYPSAGIFIAKVTAKNGSVIGTATVDVNVTSPPVAPVPDITVSCGTVTRPGSTTCSVSAKLSGVTVAASRITSVVWDFGDGSPTAISTTTTNTSTHTYLGAATYTVVVTDVVVTGTTAKGSGSGTALVQ